VPVWKRLEAWRTLRRPQFLCHGCFTGVLSCPPAHVAAHVEKLGKDLSRAGVKQELAANRILFDRMMAGKIVPFTPGTSVHGPKPARDDRPMPP